MPMTNDQFYDMTGAIFQKCLEVMVAKGADYAHDENKLANFERQADSMSLPPLVILRVYLQKHLDAFDAYVKTGKVESEPLEMRVVDIINYFCLALGLAIAGGYEGQEEWLRLPVAPLILVAGGGDGPMPFPKTEEGEVPGKPFQVIGGGGKVGEVCCNPGGDDCCDGNDDDAPSS